MIKIYGYSDDLVYIEKDGQYLQELDCFESSLRIAFHDGTTIKIGYPKEETAVWWINIVKQGKANQTLTVCHEETDDCYSDVFEIDSEIKYVRRAKIKGGNS